MEENHLRLKGEWGTFIFGNAQGVESTMARGAFSVMGGTGGFDGNFYTVVNVPTGVFIRTDLVGATKLATKATYLTPRVWGIQLGVSFTPNSEHKGENRNGEPHYLTSTKDPKEPFDINNVAGAINYSNAFANGVKLDLSLTGIFGKTRRPDGASPANNTTGTALDFFSTADRDRTKSYAVGGTIEFRGFECGAEWLDNGDSREFKNPSDKGLGGFDAGEAYSFAAAYTYGPDRISLGYYHSERKFNGSDAEADVYSVTYDRQFAPGFGVFAEYNNFGLKTHDAALTYADTLRFNAGQERELTGDGSNLPKRGTGGNNGHVLTLGMKFKF